MYATDGDFKSSPDATWSPAFSWDHWNAPLEDVANAHWKEYGRNYYARYDYEGHGSWLMSPWVTSPNIR